MANINRPCIEKKEMRLWKHDFFFFYLKKDLLSMAVFSVLEHQTLLFFSFLFCVFVQVYRYKVWYK